MPKLPNADRAIIDPRKLTAYLLNDQHPQGSAKARFFTQFGFQPANFTILADALRLHAQDHNVQAVQSTVHGVNYEIAGPLQAPDGRNPWVLVVWIIRVGEADPRLVTAMPTTRPRP